MSASISVLNAACCVSSVVLSNVHVFAFALSIAALYVFMSVSRAVRASDDTFHESDATIFASCPRFSMRPDFSVVDVVVLLSVVAA